MKPDFSNLKLTHEEKDIVESFERGEWIEVPMTEEEKKALRQSAINALRKNKRMNLRISQKDLFQLQERALNEGIPYQTLATSILHKYVSGRLIEKEYARKR